MPPTQIFQQHADHLASWLTFGGAFGGALLVAIIAAVTAQKRLRLQLSAEANRLTKQLEAEDQRHREQLSFERGETDRAELRSILDALAKHLFQLREAVSGLIATVQNMLEDDEGDGIDADYRKERLESRRERIGSEDDEIVRQIQRLSLRLGNEGDVLARKATMMRLHANSVRWATKQPSTEELAKAVSAREQLNKLGPEFISEALKFTSARLHERPPADAPS
jgi:hypothetical protein